MHSSRSLITIANQQLFAVSQISLFSGLTSFYHIAANPFIINQLYILNQVIQQKFTVYVFTPLIVKLLPTTVVLLYGTVLLRQAVPLSCMLSKFTFNWRPLPHLYAKSSGPLVNEFSQEGTLTLFLPVPIYSNYSSCFPLCPSFLWC